MTSSLLQTDIMRHLTLTLGQTPDAASVTDWRMALSHAIRDRLLTPWLEAQARSRSEGRKRVYYLSMEFLIGRLLEDALINMGLHDEVREAMGALGQDLSAIIEDEPDAALGNGGLGRLAACFMESMATLGCPAFGYGIRYEFGLFRQSFDEGRQMEAPDDWLACGNPWDIARPMHRYAIPFMGKVSTKDGVSVWHPGETVYAVAHDTPVIGWQGKWANTLRLWAAEPATPFDLASFNQGEYANAASAKVLAHTLSRVLYPDDSTYQGKELRLKQEFFLTSAALQDILARAVAEGVDLRRLHDHVAIQMNDTHPAIAGPELIRLLMDEHGMPFADAITIAQGCLGYTNHTLLPEALERWATYTFGTVLPRHMQIVEQIDAWHQQQHPRRPHYVGIVKHHEVRMGELAFITSHKVNGVSALHTELVKQTLFPELHALHPDRIINQTNGVTPRRWLKMCNPPLAGLITETIGQGWEADLDRLQDLEPHIEERSFRTAFGAAKRANKVRLSNWLKETQGLQIDPDALFDVQVKRIHEYKRQLLNILETIARWKAIRDNPTAGWVPRVTIFGGKSAPGYAVAKEIIHLINDVAAVVNSDPVTGDLLKVVYPPNYNVSMAERLVPAADLSQQISTAGKEASGTGNMKFMMNGAPTIGTLDGANVEILQEVGPENFFLFGLTAEEVLTARADPDVSRKAIEASQALRDVLQMIAEGRFSPSDPSRYHALVNRVWHHDYFLVAPDFDSYIIAQGQADRAFSDRDRWLEMAARNTARSGFFSSDRTIRSYMTEIWGVSPAI